MSYEDMNSLYRDLGQRNRFEMCVREQAHMTYANDADVVNRQLAADIGQGGLTAIDAVIAAVCVGPNSATLGDDVSLLGAVQECWNRVARSFYAVTVEPE